MMIGSFWETPEQEKAAGDSVWGNPKPCRDLRFYEATAVLCLTSMKLYYPQAVPLCLLRRPLLCGSLKPVGGYIFHLKSGEWSDLFLPLTITYSRKIDAEYLLYACECQIHLHLVLYIIFFDRKYLIILAFKYLTDILCINLITPNSILLQV